MSDSVAAKRKRGQCAKPVSAVCPNAAQIPNLKVCTYGAVLKAGTVPRDSAGDARWHARANVDTRAPSCAIAKNASAETPAFFNDELDMITAQEHWLPKFPNPSR